MKTFVGFALNGPILELLAQRQGLLIGFECLQQSSPEPVSHDMMLSCMSSHPIPVCVGYLCCAAPVAAQLDSYMKEATATRNLTTGDSNSCEVGADKYGPSPPS